MIFGLFGKKTAAPVEEPWPWPAGGLTKADASKQMEMQIRRLGPNANPSKPDLPPLVEKQIQSIDQRQAVNKLWDSEVRKAISARANARAGVKKAGDNPWG